MIEVILPFGLKLCAVAHIATCDASSVILAAAERAWKSGPAQISVCADAVPCPLLDTDDCAALARIFFTTDEAKSLHIAKPGWSTWFVCRPPKPTS